MCISLVSHSESASTHAGATKHEALQLNLHVRVTRREAGCELARGGPLLQSQRGGPLLQPQRGLPLLQPHLPPERGVNEGGGTGKEKERDRESQRETDVTWVRDDASAAKVLPLGKDFQGLQNAADCVCKSMLLHLQSAMHFPLCLRAQECLSRTTTRA